MVDNPRQGDEIEITQEMLEAGGEIIRQQVTDSAVVWTDQASECLAELVFVAMALHLPKPPKPESH